MTPTPNQIKAVFLSAVDKTVLEERNAYLDHVCAGNANLRQRVEALLGAHDKADALLDQPAEQLVENDEPRPLKSTGEQRGEIIGGRFKLIERIGEGGMGSVWLAEQTQPVVRKVALKLIRPGMDTKAVLARFEAERQAIAIMDHPNIAKVLDAGATDSHRPFFVMEYVKGVPITQFCDQARLSVSERLSLFVPVCRAVQHAHQKGVIHRDLKPSNILVCLYDGVPVPKVIDFGLAKATQQPLTEASLHTAHGVVMGTPLYMSPEQAELNNLDIDTRSDVYALGVVLYELLTGTTPLEKKRFQAAAWLEMMRLIKEEEPPRPSARLSGNDTAPSVAAQRSLEPVQLAKLIRGDLDLIVMKALEKDRGRRYDSANGFAEDINRYLTGSPVIAHPPSRGYRLRKFIRRHRPQVIAASVVLLALIAGIVGTTLGMMEAREQRDAKEVALVAETTQRQLAEVRLAKLDKGLEILGSVFANLDPLAEERGGEKLRVALSKQLDRASGELQGDAIGDPLTVARLQNTLASSLHGMGQHAKAARLFEQAIATRAELLGEEYPDTLALRVKLAHVYLSNKQNREAIELFERSVPALARQLGPDDPQVLRARANYATALATRSPAAAVRELEAVVQRYEAIGQNGTRQGLIASNRLAHAYLTLGNGVRAVAILEPVLLLAESALGIEDYDTVIVRTNLAMAYEMSGQIRRCLPLLQKAFDALVVKLGEEHPITLAARLNLALSRSKAGQRQGAMEELERLHKIHESRSGTSHPMTLKVTSQLGWSMILLGKSDDAVPILKRTLELQQSALGSEAEIVFTRGALAQAYVGLRQFDKAIPLREMNVALLEKKPDESVEQFVIERYSLEPVIDFGM